MQYNHGQSSNATSESTSVDTASLAETYAAVVEETRVEAEVPTAELPVAFEGPAAEETPEAPALIGTEVFQTEETEVAENVENPSAAAETEVSTTEVETPAVEVETPEVSSETTDNTESGDSSDNSSSGNPEGFEWGNGNGEGLRA